MNYGEMIKSAFWISWRNKFLWFFGFFAAGSGGASNVFNVPSEVGSQEDFSGMGRWMSDNVVALLVVLAVIAFALALVYIVLSFVSAGGLAESVAAIDRGEERHFSSTLRAGLANFWRVLGQAILIFLIGLGLLLVVALIAGLPIALTFVLSESVGARVVVSALFGVLGVLLLIVFFVALSIIGQFALRGLVVDRERITHSIAAGYGLLRRSVGRSLLVWLINLGLSIGIGIAVLVVVLIVGFFLFLPTILLSVAEYATAAIVAGVVAGLILVPIFLVISGAVGAFSHAYWTLAYLRLTDRPGREPEPAEGAVA
ncbi:MAG TPA: hypothetical protein VK869_13320 [Rubrobacteraceae bacterium]|nr:hypothetical protein [Rubrobacteraceae bacterium]